MGPQEGLETYQNKTRHLNQIEYLTWKNVCIYKGVYIMWSSWFYFDVIHIIVHWELMLFI